MNAYRPPRTAAIRWINGIGRALGAVGVRATPLDDAILLDKASRATGLDDFGDEAFREPLRVHLAALEEEAKLTPVGRVIAQRDTLRILENRLRLVDERKRHPEIGDETIEKPLFIVGLPRTGTSILHELMAQDPENRTPMTWEVMWPLPRPRAETFESDPRIAKADAHFKAIDQLIPGFKKMHPMGARLPQECVMLMAHEFLSMQFHCSNRVPSYQEWFERRDLTPAYISHKEQLKLLQSLAPAVHWVLKSPQHLWTLDALLRVYPDACVVQTHRDPVKVAASVASLVSLLRGMGCDDVDPLEIGADWSERIALGLERSMAVRDGLGEARDRILDVHFHEYMKDPIGMIRRIYDHFGRELSDEAERRMRTFLADHPRDEHGRHEYTLEGVGLDLESERKRFERYQQRFRIPDEEKS